MFYQKKMPNSKGSKIHKKKHSINAQKNSCLLLIIGNLVITLYLIRMNAYH